MILKLDIERVRTDVLVVEVDTDHRVRLQRSGFGRHLLDRHVLRLAQFLLVRAHRGDVPGRRCRPQRLDGRAGEGGGVSEVFAPLRVPGGPSEGGTPRGVERGTCGLRHAGGAQSGSQALLGAIPASAAPARFGSIGYAVHSGHWRAVRTPACCVRYARTRAGSKAPPRVRSALGHDACVGVRPRAD